MIPCISIGNLAMGGRGKTPVAIAIARWLVARGERPAVLSRGYRRRLREPGVVVVSDGVHQLGDLARSGDEPLLIARSVPGAAVLVCDERATAAVFAREILGATVLVLDDGFQHRAVARDVDLVIVTPKDLRDRRLPFGRLRESVSALKRADVVLLDLARGEDPPDAPLALPSFTLVRSLGDAQLLEPDRFWPGDDAPMMALAGIARPRRFAQSLLDAGWTVADVIAFEDHHPYSARDLDNAAQLASRACALALLTTEKDAMRLLPLRPFPIPIAAVPLAITIEPGPAGANGATAGDFWTWLGDRINQARAAASA